MASRHCPLPAGETSVCWRRYQTAILSRESRGDEDGSAVLMHLLMH